MIIIQASNVHISGGAVLLRGLLEACSINKVQTILYVDKRFEFSDAWLNCVFPIKVKKSVISRLGVEFALKKQALRNSDSFFLFFGNLPPLFKSTQNAYLFFQNVILLEENGHFNFVLLIKIKHFFEKLWLKLGLKNINTVFVQSESVKRLFLKDFPNANVKVFAFYDLPQISNASPKTQDFIYVASSDPHKNHLNLIKAWTYLFENGVKSKLTLTASNFSNQEQEIFDSAIAKGVNIEVRPNLSYEEVLKLYCSAKALIYPSLAESFGLPLLEAKQAGLPIIASELDFVRDLVEPAQTFDPNSEVSIARAVQRFLKMPETEKTEVKTAADFINAILTNSNTKLLE